MQANETVNPVTSDEWQALHRRPDFAWPTLALFAASIGLFSVVFSAAVSGRIAAPLAVLLNILPAYWCFTVFHDAAHNAISRHRVLNEWVGRIAMMAFSPAPLFRPFRYVHMQHHRFVNETDGSDPDRWASTGPWWQWPLRWATTDAWYVVWYVMRFRDRPRDERREVIWCLLAAVPLVGWLVWSGWWEPVLWFWFLPSRLASIILALSLDVLPHWPFKATHAENPWQATSNRLGWETFLTPLMLGQNYHLVHHIYPLVPFYRYRRVWLAREAWHLSRQPLLVSVGGREIPPGVLR